MVAYKLLVLLFMFSFLIGFTCLSIVFLIMKQKSKSTPENIRTHLSQNQKINIRDNTHGLVKCNTQNDITQKHSCSQFVAPSASNIPGAPLDRIDAPLLKS